MSNINIRLASISDAPQLLDIYKPYVENTAITFEYTTPTVDEFALRIQCVLEKYPYIVAVEDKHIIGYAYASPFKQRDAYAWAVETSIYVKQNCRGKGYGRILYTELERILKMQNIINLNACIAFTDCEDKHLDNSSMSFHYHMGYTLIGKFTKCGYKSGKWYDMIWMEKFIGDHPDTPPHFIPFPEIRGEI